MTLNDDEIGLEEIVDLTIELLADEQGRDPAELRCELQVEGVELPIDSQLIAEILSRVETACGVRIPADAEAARSLRSVYTFAATVLAAVRAARVRGAHRDIKKGQDR